MFLLLLWVLSNMLQRQSVVKVSCFIFSIYASFTMLIFRYDQIVVNKMHRSRYNLIITMQNNRIYSIRRPIRFFGKRKKYISFELSMPKHYQKHPKYHKEQLVCREPFSNFMSRLHLLLQARGMYFWKCNAVLNPF